MRFHWGSLPEYGDFQPDSAWQSFDDNGESIWLWQFKALPIAIMNVVIIVLIWIVLTPVEGLLREITFPLPIVGFLVCLLSVLATHELLHALAHPRAGLSARTTIGFWPSRMLLYATYGGELSRNRYVAILLVPTVVISFVPIFVAILAQAYNIWLVYITVLNAFLASGDILATRIMLQLPANAVIHNQGQNAYWKVDDTPQVL